MGLCDLIPGISGGTVAYLTGIYDPLITNIKNIRYFRQLNYSFLFTLILGIISALLFFSSTIKWCMQHPILRLCLFSFFFGLVITTAILNLKNLKKTKGAFFWFNMGMFFAFLLTTHFQFEKRREYSVQFSKQELYLSTYNKEIANYDEALERLTLLDFPTAYFLAKQGKSVYWREHLVSLSELEHLRPSPLQPKLIAAGVIAGFAMLLPGISGSTMLHLCGVYTSSMCALSALTTQAFNFFDFFYLCNIALGALLGIFICSRCIFYFFKHFKTRTLVFLSGLVIGSMKALWPFCYYCFYLVPKLDSFEIQYEPLGLRLPTIDSNFIGALGFIFLGSAIALTLEFLPALYQKVGKKL